MSDKDQQLKPCPFCDYHAVYYDKGYSSYPYFRVECNYTECLIEPSTKEYESKKEARAAWNTRPNVG